MPKVTVTVGNCTGCESQAVLIDGYGGCCSGAGLLNCRQHVVEMPPDVANRSVDLGKLRRSDVVPDEIKDLIIPIVTTVRELEGEIAGKIELAFRRGVYTEELRGAEVEGE